MTTSDTDTCYYCGKPADLRPYGPAGALICYPCGTSPAHARETAQRFGDRLETLLRTAGPGGSLLITDRGITPQRTEDN